MERRLDYDFFAHHVAQVAQALLGKILVWGPHRVMITETEAYRGADDEASHAFKNTTTRAQIMFGPPGFIYVYLIYGVHHCLNIVTEPQGSPSAVLIRAVKDMSTGTLINGPGNVCKFLGITRNDKGINIVENPGYAVFDTMIEPSIIVTQRVGITKNKDIPWRFMMK